MPSLLEEVIFIQKAEEMNQAMSLAAEVVSKPHACSHLFQQWESCQLFGFFCRALYTSLLSL